MKKFFTLIAMALMAVGASAQVYDNILVFTDKDKDALNCTVEGDNLKIELKSNKSSWSKTDGSKDSKNFGFADDTDETMITTESIVWKSGGSVTGKEEGASDDRYVKVTVPSAGYLFICARTSSSSNTNDLCLTVNDVEVKISDTSSGTKNKNNHTVYPYAKVAVPKGVVNIKTFALSDTEENKEKFGCGAPNVNFYGFAFKADGTVGIQNVKAAAAENAAAFNLAGQKVGTDYKGIIVKNGKKVVIK